MLEIRGHGNVLFISFVNSKVSKCKFVTSCHERSVMEFLGEIFSKLSKLDLKMKGKIVAYRMWIFLIKTVPVLI